MKKIKYVKNVKQKTCCLNCSRQLKNNIRTLDRYRKGPLSQKSASTILTLTLT